MTKTDEDFFEIAREAYGDWAIGSTVRGFDEKTYKIVDILNNPDGNGAQGFAVVPVINGQPDYSQVTIAYRGTEPTKFDGDLTTDIEQIFLGQQNKVNWETFPGTTIRVPVESKTQFDTALEFAEKVKNDPRFKDAAFDYTGHSLGGGLASYVAAEYQELATVFSAPNVYRLLSKEAKKWVDEGYAREFIINYTHMNDSVGNFDQFGQPTVGKRVHTKRNKELENFIMSILTLGGHPTTTFLEMFNSDGSIIMLFEPTLLRATAAQYDEMKNTALEMKKTIEQYEADEQEEIDSLQQHINSEAAGGAYSELEDHEIQDILKGVAPFSEGGDYFAHDPEVVSDLKGKLNDIADKLGEFAESLRGAATKAEESDAGIATSF